MASVRVINAPFRASRLLTSRFLPASTPPLLHPPSPYLRLRSHSTCPNVHTCTTKRCLQTSIPKLEPAEVVQSTALLEKVKVKEEEVVDKTVGEGEKEILRGGKGAEGGHFRENEIISINQSDLSDPTRTGPWTLSHPVYTADELQAVKVVWRNPETWTDRIAAGLVKFARKTFDFSTRYTHKPLPENHASLPLATLRSQGYLLTPDAWLMRCLFLESIAGVPGMVAGVLRHLRSLRLMRRDGGWISTLLQEAENERMHLLTFMTIKQPSIFFRAMVLGAQGVFFNLFFLTYLINPKAAHRFVGNLEEEACFTYTRIVEDMERGHLPEWAEMKAPAIAIDYWRLPEESTMKDVILAIRSDESQHRFVNHTLANLDQKRDFNPFALKEPEPEIKGTKPGFTRQEAAEFARKAHEEVMGTR